MLSFARGLVLRKGARTLEFERDLGGGKVQFKYLDTFEVNTFQVSKLYRQILSGEITQVFANPPSSRQEFDDTKIIKLPSTLNQKQEALIAFRMAFVSAAIRARAAPKSTNQLGKVINDVCKQGVAANNIEPELLSSFKPPKPATLMAWLKRFQREGNNPFALCDRRPLAKKPKRINRTIEVIVDQMISRHYLQLRGKSIKATHEAICNEIRQTNRRDGSELTLPGEKTIARRIHEIPEFVRDSKRLGVGYARNKWRYSMKGDQSTRILERVEIDHTLLDVWVLDPRSGVPLGRPWITVVMDRLSGYILGLYISFYGPSSGTVAKAIRSSILPKDELIAGIPEIDAPWTAMGVPECYVVDNGLEFHSRAFRRIGWHLRTDIIYNPVRQPWLKASVERVMMELNRTLPLAGKVFAPLKNAQIINPAKSAAISFDDLCCCLLIWAVKVYPFHIHPKTLVRSIDIWEEGLQSSPPALLPTDLTPLDLAAGISTERTITGDGVFFHYLRYNSLELQEYRRRYSQSFRTEIRVDPDDLGLIYVHLPKADRWIQVEAQRPSLEYASGTSLLQHELIRSEAGKNLTKSNAEEILLIAKADLQDRWIGATKRGIRSRKDLELIRAQGMSSARIGIPNNPKDQIRRQVPEPSIAMSDALTTVIPYTAYSMEEDTP